MRSSWVATRCNELTGFVPEGSVEASGSRLRDNKPAQVALLLLMLRPELLAPLRAALAAVRSRVPLPSFVRLV